MRMRQAACLATIAAIVLAAECPTAQATAWNVGFDFFGTDSSPVSQTRSGRGLAISPDQHLFAAFIQGSTSSGARKLDTSQLWGIDPLASGATACTGLANPSAIAMNCSIGNDCWSPTSAGLSACNTVSGGQQYYTAAAGPLTHQYTSGSLAKIPLYNTLGYYQAHYIATDDRGYLYMARTPGTVPASSASNRITVWNANTLAPTASPSAMVRLQTMEAGDVKGIAVQHLGDNYYIYVSNTGSDAIQRWNCGPLAQPKCAQDTNWGDLGNAFVADAPFNVSTAHQLNNVVGGIEVDEDGNVFATVATDEAVKGSGGNKVLKLPVDPDSTNFNILPSTGWVTSDKVQGAMDVAAYGNKVYVAQYRAKESGIAILNKADLSATADSPYLTSVPRNYGCTSVSESAVSPTGCDSDSGYSSIAINAAGKIYVMDQLYDLIPAASSFTPPGASTAFSGAKWNFDRVLVSPFVLPDTSPPAVVVPIAISPSSTTVNAAPQSLRVTATLKDRTGIASVELAVYAPGSATPMATPVDAGCASPPCASPLANPLSVDTTVMLTLTTAGTYKVCLAVTDTVPTCASPTCTPATAPNARTICQAYVIVSADVKGPVVGTISLTSPLTAATAPQTITVAAPITDNTGVASTMLTFYAPGGTSLAGYPMEFNCNSNCGSPYAFAQTVQVTFPAADPKYKLCLLPTDSEGNIGVKTCVEFAVGADVVAPVIGAITLAAAPTTAGTAAQDLTLQSTITDATGVGSVKLVLYAPDGTTKLLDPAAYACPAAGCASPYAFQKTVSAVFAVGGDYKVCLLATDSAPAATTTDPAECKTFTVAADTTGPAITNIVLAPSSSSAMTDAKDVTVTAKVTDGTGVSSVRLWVYELDGTTPKAGFPVDISCLATSAVCTVPALTSNAYSIEKTVTATFTAAGTYKFCLKAWDTVGPTAGPKECQDFIVAVDSTGPVVESLAIGPATINAAAAAQDIVVSATVKDGTGIASVTLFLYKPNNGSSLADYPVDFDCAGSFCASPLAFSQTVQAALPAGGTYKACLQATDSVAPTGTTGSKVCQPFTVVADTAAPAIGTITATPPAGTSASAQDLIVQAEITDRSNVASVTMKLTQTLGGTTTVLLGPTTYNCPGGGCATPYAFQKTVQALFTSTTTDAYTVCLTAKDTFGNPSVAASNEKCQSFTIALDKTSPVIGMLSLPASIYVANPGTSQTMQVSALITDASGVDKASVGVTTTGAGTSASVVHPGPSTESACAAADCRSYPFTSPSIYLDVYNPGTYEVCVTATDDAANAAVKCTTMAAAYKPYGFTWLSPSGALSGLISTSTGSSQTIVFTVQANNTNGAYLNTTSTFFNHPNALQACPAVENSQCFSDGKYDVKPDAACAAVPYTLSGATKTITISRTQKKTVYQWTMAFKVPTNLKGTCSIFRFKLDQGPYEPLKLNIK